jgi:hypothetical protein
VESSGIDRYLSISYDGGRGRETIVAANTIKAIHLRLDEPTYQALAKRAKEGERTVTQEVRLAIRQYLARQSVEERASR